MTPLCIDYECLRYLGWLIWELKCNIIMHDIPKQSSIREIHWIQICWRFCIRIVPNIFYKRFSELVITDLEIRARSWVIYMLQNIQDWLLFPNISVISWINSLFIILLLGLLWELKCNIIMHDIPKQSSIREIHWIQIQKGSNHLIYMD
jgi:hypothetical protein